MEVPRWLFLPDNSILSVDTSPSRPQHARLQCIIAPALSCCRTGIRDKPGIRHPAFGIRHSAVKHRLDRSVRYHYRRLNHSRSARNW